MKRSAQALGFYALLASVWSCSKDQNHGTKSTVLGSLRWEGLEVVDTWHDNGAQPGVEGVDYGCWGDPVDCLEEITIEGDPPASAISNVFDAIETGVRETIAGAFEEERELLEEWIPAQQVAAVVNSSATASARFGTLSYIIIKDNSNRVLGAYPFDLP